VKKYILGCIDHNHDQNYYVLRILVVFLNKNKEIGDENMEEKMSFHKYLRLYIS